MKGLLRIPRALKLGYANVCECVSMVRNESYGRVFRSSISISVTPATAFHKGPLAVKYFENRAEVKLTQSANRRKYE